MIKSIYAGKILDIDSKPTLSDGTAGGLESGSITFPICCEYIDQTILVTEDEIKKAMELYYNNEKLKMLINKKNKLTNDPRPVYISSNY